MGLWLEKVYILGANPHGLGGKDINTCIKNYSGVPSLNITRTNHVVARFPVSGDAPARARARARTQAPSEVPYHQYGDPEPWARSSGSRAARSHVYPNVGLGFSQPTGMNQSAMHIHAVSLRSPPMGGENKGNNQSGEFLPLRSEFGGCVTLHLVYT